MTKYEIGSSHCNPRALTLQKHGTPVFENQLTVPVAAHGAVLVKLVP